MSIIVALFPTVLRSQAISNSPHSAVTNVDFPTQNSLSGFVSSNGVLANISIPGGPLLDTSGGEALLYLHSSLTATLLSPVSLLPYTLHSYNGMAFLVCCFCSFQAMSVLLVYFSVTCMPSYHQSSSKEVREVVSVSLKIE